MPNRMINDRRTNIINVVHNITVILLTSIKIAFYGFIELKSRKNKIHVFNRYLILFGNSLVSMDHPSLDLAL